MPLQKADLKPEERSACLLLGHHQLPGVRSRVEEAEQDDLVVWDLAATDVMTAPCIPVFCDSHVYGVVQMMRRRRSSRCQKLCGQPHARKLSIPLTSELPLRSCLAGFAYAPSSFEVNPTLK